MKRFTRARTAGLALTCIALGTVFGPSLARGAADSLKDVIVRNSASQPVPVAPQGTTQVGGTVKVDDSTPVKTQGTSERLDRFSMSKSLVSPDDEGAPDGIYTLFTVPAGKRFVSDFLSVKGDCRYAQEPDPFYVSMLGGDSTFLDIPLDVIRRPSNRVFFQYAGPALFWADGGKGVYWQPRTSAVTCWWTINIAGHFEPLT